jgi:hypothetical protein
VKANSAGFSTFQQTLQLPASGLTSLGRGMKALLLHLPFTVHDNFYTTASELALIIANCRICQTVGKPCNIQCSLISKAEVICEEECSAPAHDTNFCYYPSENIVNSSLSPLLHFILFA